MSKIESGSDKEVSLTAGQSSGMDICIDGYWEVSVRSPAVAVAEIPALTQVQDERLMQLLSGENRSAANVDAAQTTVDSVSPAADDDDPHVVVVGKSAETFQQRQFLALESSSPQSPAEHDMSPPADIEDVALQQCENNGSTEDSSHSGIANAGEPASNVDEAAIILNNHNGISFISLCFLSKISTLTSSFSCGHHCT
ncbi:hypothetical protein COLO4_03909 [Corchorus olitorius]|uniref:Uncharacterized protein n=1 Tax=Corchorus olitorius TaxID=93759 RepID=A0A1R3KVZ1_9ROSI|nr:hypothetical protein COLO4_03909 [Corchorus olitorius]